LGAGASDQQTNAAACRAVQCGTALMLSGAFTGIAPRARRCLATKTSA
jgi:hypothetical protein